MSNFDAPSTPYWKYARVIRFDIFHNLHQFQSLKIKPPILAIRAYFLFENQVNTFKRTIKCKLSDD